MRAKRAILRAAKAIGLFSLARVLTRDRLRILAYHGNDVTGESAFMPTVFMRGETFRRRLELLREKGYPVLPLGDAVRRLRGGSLPPCAVAITIDDGFHSTLRVAAPLLKAAGFPATLYVTTYYTRRDVPVFRLAMQHCFFRSRVKSVELARLVPFTAGDAETGPSLLWELINYGEQELDEAGRSALLEATASALDVDLAPILASRAFHLMTPAELDEAAKTLDLQLHTHRHRLPADPVRVRAEIEENRNALQPHATRPLVHFCYPSGYHAARMFEWLAAAGIETATTCEAGLNGRGANPLALTRFLDGENVTLLELEAELSGFTDLLRRARRLLCGPARVVALDPEEERRGYPAGSGRSLLDRVRGEERVA